MKDFIDLGKVGGVDGRADCQSGWGNYLGQKFTNKTILDVGAGLCKNKFRLSKGNNVVTTQDIFPGFTGDLKVPVEQILDKTFDVVVSLDVIEHIENYTSFLAQLVRIAKEYVCITTPNYNISENRNPYHFQEFTPFALTKLLDFYRVESFLYGDSDGWKPRATSDINEFLNHNMPHHGFILRVNQ